MWGQLADNEVVRSPLMPLIEQVSLARPIWTESILGIGCFHVACALNGYKGRQTLAPRDCKEGNRLAVMFTVCCVL